MSMWLFILGNLFESDIIAYDVCNPIGKAVKRAGLCMIILEIAFLCNYANDPFNSHAFLNAFVDCVRNCFAFNNSGSPLWDDHFYRQIAKDYGMLSVADFGTPEHSKKGRKAVKDDQMMYKAGDSVKLARCGSVWDKFEGTLHKQWFDSQLWKLKLL